MTQNLLIKKQNSRRNAKISFALMRGQVYLIVMIANHLTTLYSKVEIVMKGMLISLKYSQISTLQFKGSRVEFVQYSQATSEPTCFRAIRS